MLVGEKLNRHPDTNTGLLCQHPPAPVTANHAPALDHALDQLGLVADWSQATDRQERLQLHYRASAQDEVLVLWRALVLLPWLQRLLLPFLLGEQRLSPRTAPQPYFADPSAKLLPG